MNIPGKTKNEKTHENHANSRTHQKIEINLRQFEPARSRRLESTTKQQKLERSLEHARTPAKPTSPGKLRKLGKIECTGSRKTMKLGTNKKTSEDSSKFQETQEKLKRSRKLEKS